MSSARVRMPVYVLVVVLAGAAFALTALVPWNVDPRIRRATGIVVATLILWISEAAPLGVTGLLIPIAGTFAGLLKWPEALAAWGDPILFLFLGAFLLARGLEKHHAFDALLQAQWLRRFRGGEGLAMAMVVLLSSGLLSTALSNTAVAAMMLPVVLAVARTVRRPALVLLALSYGATFGGMATPIGTPPNFIGYGAMKHLDNPVNFVSWMRVGVPIWLGMAVLTWGLLVVVAALSRRLGVRTAEVAVVPEGADGPPSEELQADVPDGPDRPSTVVHRAARRWAVAAFAVTAIVWLGSGILSGVFAADSPVPAWLQRYLPESLVPVLVASLLFLIRVGPHRERVLDRRDFQTLDWDTIFLIAGGLCLGKILQSSGAAAALAQAVGQAHVSPLVAMFGVGGVTVLLSELTSNTATAALMVPIAASLAPAVGLSPVQAIWLVSLCASLGFALPVSTPPNAIVYGTRLIPLRLMATVGIMVDILALIWVVCCVRWLA